MIKAFLFDNDGVITAASSGNEISRRLATSLGVGVDTANSLMMSVWPDFTVGKLSEEQFWDSIQKQSGQTIAPEQRAIWKTWEELMPQSAILKLIRGLRGSGYKVGMVSNVIPNTEALIREHGGYDEFDFTVLSCKVGYSKPNPKVYELALQQLGGIRPEEVVFLDDQDRNLVLARELGMQTILVESEQQAITEVNALLQANL